MGRPTWKNARNSFIIIFPAAMGPTSHPTEIHLIDGPPHLHYSFQACTRRSCRSLSSVRDVLQLISDGEIWKVDIGRPTISRMLDTTYISQTASARLLSIGQRRKLVRIAWAFVRCLAKRQLLNNYIGSDSLLVSHGNMSPVSECVLVFEIIGGGSSRHDGTMGTRLKNIWSVENIRNVSNRAYFIVPSTGPLYPV